VIGTVIAAGLTSMALMGNYTYFGSTPATLDTAADWLAVPVTGVVGGLTGGVFSRFVITMARGLPGSLGSLIKRHKILFAAVCGFAVALCGLASGNVIYGTGYSQIKPALEGDVSLAQSFGGLKLAATALTTVSGIPGGIFSPSLAVGAGFGANLSALFPGTPVQALLLLGMVSYFAGVVQAPITAFVIVTEMTQNHSMVVPLMAASLIAWAVSRTINREGIYHALAENFASGNLRSREPV
jgi:H+/Cl- antiporter ClcA